LALPLTKSLCQLQLKRRTKIQFSLILFGHAGQRRALNTAAVINLDVKLHIARDDSPRTSWPKGDLKIKEIRD